MCNSFVLYIADNQTNRQVIVTDHTIIFIIFYLLCKRIMSQNVQKDANFHIQAKLQYLLHDYFSMIPFSFH
jgi:low affinity Fe/Cu permease